MQAIELLQEIEDPYQRAYLLVSIASKLTESDCISETKKVAQSIDDPSIRALDLCELIECIKAHSISECFAKQIVKALCSINDDKLKAAIQIQLLPYVPEKVKQNFLLETITTILKIRNSSCRSEAMICLMPDLVSLPPNILYGFWRKMLSTLATYTRENLLSDMCFLIPLISSMSDQKTILETYQALQDVGKWWP